MGYHPFARELRVHAFRVIHTYDAFAAFEAEIVRYGMHELPINEEPDLSAQEHEQEARDAARWAWDRKATITPYDEFVKGKRIKPVVDRRAWAKQWAQLRKEFLSGRLLDVLVQPAPGGEGYWWECPVCGALGSEVKRESTALKAGRGHMQTHVTPEDLEALEDLKVTNMPEQLLTPFQRERRALLKNEK